MPCTNCSGERFFSALKRIKSRLRSCLTEVELSETIWRCLLLNNTYIKKNILWRIFDGIIDEFAKERKKKNPRSYKLQ